MDFTPLLGSYSKPNWGKPSAHNFIRGQFRIETFMIFGALGQVILSALLPIRYAVLPACLLLLYKIADVYAMKTGLKANPHMFGTITDKFSAQFPDSEGKFGSQPARSGVAVFLIGARSNSPMGMFHQEFKEMGDFMNGMMEELKANPDSGFLGTSTWLGTERASNSGMLQVMYFKSAAHVHEYAHGPLHRKAWEWWYKQKREEITIYHELYEVPSGNYEAVYVNTPPLLLADTQHRIVRKGKNGEETEWMSPVVGAKGQLKSSKGRMARSQGSENDKYGYDMS